MLHISEEDLSFLKSVNCFPNPETYESPTYTCYGISMFLPVKDGRKTEYTIWNQSILDKIISALKSQKNNDLITPIVSEHVENLWEIDESRIRNPHFKKDKKTNITYLVSPVRKQFHTVYKYAVVEENDNFVYHMSLIDNEFSNNAYYSLETSYKNKNTLNEKLFKLIDSEITRNNEIIKTLENFKKTVIDEDT